MMTTVSVDKTVAAGSPTVSTTAAATLPGTVFGSTREISPRIPAALLTRTPEYHGAPVDTTLWWHRHRDLPAIFREATYLWTEEQRAAIGALWPPGWQSDADHPLHRSKGTVRLSSSYNANELHRQVSAHARTANVRRTGGAGWTGALTPSVCRRFVCAFSTARNQRPHCRQ